MSIGLNKGTGGAGNVEEEEEEEEEEREKGGRGGSERGGRRGRFSYSRRTVANSFSHWFLDAVTHLKNGPIIRGSDYSGTFIAVFVAYLVCRSPD